LIIFSKDKQNKINMEDWVLSIVFHYPHNRLAIGWEFINADEKENYYTINVFLFIATLTLDMFPRT
jgi:hypothetical protein